MKDWYFLLILTSTFASVAELVDALDSKPSSYECGFDSRPGYQKGLSESLGPFFIFQVQHRYNISLILLYTLSLILFKFNLY